jgi:ubiquinone/menaquinone biosynthesis C-methylase UbiE
MKGRIFPDKGGTINFSRFTYSKNHHIALFTERNYELELFGKAMDLPMWPLKRYQDLLIFSFIKQVIPEGSKILEVGGGNSRIIAHFKDKYECWNVDKLEGVGLGPTQIDSTGFHLVKDYIGNFNSELSNDYFDFVFSISALEHVGDKDPFRLDEVLRDLNRVLKPSCYSLHCFDSVLKPKKIWTNRLLTYIFEKEKTINQFVPYTEVCAAKDLFVLPESIYNKNWFPRNSIPYNEYGKPFSYNVLWRKE